MTTISAHTYDALREKFDELRAENARLRADLAAAPRWVSVTERLPDTMRAFTVRLSDGDDARARCRNGEWANSDGRVLNVTHWLDTAIINERG